ncbi:MAG: cytochrome c3 family protein, partial [bacterium]|nr:cytochrome c3 family protein [bacterium]
MNKRCAPACLALVLLLAATCPPAARAAGPFRSKTCLDCHTDQKKAAGAPHAHAPFAKAECEACHEVHGVVGRLALKESGNALCAGCHAP